MKVRLFHDSIRFRLSPDEVEALWRQGRLENITCFSPTRSLVFVLSTTVDVQTLQARLEESRVVVLVPTAAAQKLLAADQLSLSHDQPSGPETSLKILIEKDFECIDRDKNEPGVEFFPNPRKVTD